MINTIKQRMSKKGINQKQLSELSGVRQAAISQFLNGKQQLQTDSLGKIMDVLGLKIR